MRLVKNFGNINDGEVIAVNPCETVEERLWKSFSTPSLDSGILASEKSGSAS